MEDKVLICKDCGNEFIFSVQEQEFFAEKGFQNEPARCFALSETCLSTGQKCEPSILHCYLLRLRCRNTGSF